VLCESGDCNHMGPDFNDVGFILTDYCTDFYDGKQLTIATYI
jgi:hypothetical protein